MTEPHPASQYSAGAPILSLMRQDQIDTLAALLAEVKLHGYGEIEIVVRDHRVELFRVTTNHK